MDESNKNFKQELCRIFSRAQFKFNCYLFRMQKEEEEEEEEEEVEEEEEEEEEVEERRGSKIHLRICFGSPSPPVVAEETGDSVCLFLSFLFGYVSICDNNADVLAQIS